MATRTASRQTPGRLMSGKTITFTGNLNRPLDSLTKLVERAGGTVVAGVTEKLDYLVAGPTRSGNPTPAEKLARRLVQKNGAAINILDVSDFLALFEPTRDEVLAAIRKGGDLLERLETLMYLQVPLPDLSGADLRGARPKFTAHWVPLQTIRLDGADLRDAHLQRFGLPELHNVKLDGADLSHGSVHHLEGCSARNAKLEETRLNPAEFKSSDLTGACLAKVNGYYTQATDVIFKKADLREAEFEGSKFHNVDFTQANLKGARLGECEIHACKLNGANLHGADLTRAKFTSCDLSSADLRDTVLIDADLSGAVIDGANFAGANLAGANLKGLDVTKAKNLSVQDTRPPGQAGPNLTRLEQLAGQSDRLDLTLRADLDKNSHVTLQVSASRYGVSGYHSVVQDQSSVGRPGLHGATFSACLLDLANRYRKGSLQVDDIKVRASKCPLRVKELKPLAVAACLEAFGQPVPSEETMQEQTRARKAGQKNLQAEMIELLRTGKKGVEQWNALPEQQRKKAGKFRRADLTSIKLHGVQFGALDFDQARFDQCELPKANFYNASLKEASFQEADLNGAMIAGVKALDASFRAAKLTGCNLRGASYRRASFVAADLSKADFSYSDIGGADFTQATLVGVTFYDTRFDHETKFPAGYQLPEEGLVWKGVGKDPRLAVRQAAHAAAGPVDLDTFLQRLEDRVDGAKLKKALSMLKADRFRLYAQVTDAALVGIVKSQSDPDLVYSCRLDKDGVYACCTQNLNICGGLRGSLCKHLLVLIVGLSKGGALDPTQIDGWVDSSQGQKPALDKDAMSETFLRYKGAEAGEIDWRPTETIPEDYYAL
ncbi:MAG: pentapeptide repeat-containing protein [Gemmataceae bacterium]